MELDEKMKNFAKIACVMALVAATPVAAQFTGPGASGALVTATEASAARAGTYVTLEGNIVAHLREDYFTFRDASGEIRVEVDEDAFQNRPVSPETRVRLLGEVDNGRSGPYVWVRTLEILP
jgi:uncharacterized protein (TIGR00156 family)